MSNQAGLGDLVQQTREASANITLADAKHDKRLDGIEASINELFKKTQRPGAEWTASDEVAERKSAVGLCQIHRGLVAEGDATAADYTPSSTEIQTAMRARQSLAATTTAAAISGSTYRISAAVAGRYLRVDLPHWRRRSRPLKATAPDLFGSDSRLRLPTYRQAPES
jgi:hypothetical protein